MFKSVFFVPKQLIFLIVGGNFLFMALDVAIAHSYNKFALLQEWIPLFYSILSGMYVIYYSFLVDSNYIQQTLFRLLLFIGLGIGIIGMYWHWHGATLQEFSLKSLVYAAPLVAPLAYAGNAIVAMVSDSVWLYKKRVLLLLVSGGFWGNFFLSILDHARNGFFYSKEWAGVFIAALGGIAFLWGSLKRTLSKEDQKILLMVSILEFLTGIAGFIFHLCSFDQTVSLIDNLLFGVPLFAPLLFSDIAILGVAIIMMSVMG